MFFIKNHAESEAGRLFLDLFFKKKVKEALCEVKASGLELQHVR